MDVIAPRHHWRGRLRSLIARHGACLPAMDFPDDWQSRPIWRCG